MGLCEELRAYHQAILMMDDTILRKPVATRISNDAEQYVTAQVQLYIAVDYVNIDIEHIYLFLFIKIN